MPFDPLELADHFTKHGADFGAQTALDYEQSADRFLFSPLPPTAHQCAQRSGHLIRYDVTTEEYGIVSPAGIVETYYKPVPCATLPPPQRVRGCHPYPDNITYFQAKCAR